MQNAVPYQAERDAQAPIVTPELQSIARSQIAILVPCLRERRRDCPVQTDYISHYDDRILRSLLASDQIAAFDHAPPSQEGNEMFIVDLVRPKGTEMNAAFEFEVTPDGLVTTLVTVGMP